MVFARELMDRRKKIFLACHCGIEQRKSSVYV